MNKVMATTEEVLRLWISPSASPDVRKERLELFDRWLNEIRAKAWDEGFLRGEKSGVSEIPLNPRKWNPYRPNEK